MSLPAAGSNSMLSATSLDTANITDRQELAHYYLKKHRIMDLFDNLTSSLLHVRPEYPKDFMIEYISKLRTSKLAGVDYPSLFDESNIRSLFGMMDPAGKGYISHSQYKSGMENLGVTTYERRPPGSEEEQIGLDTFISEAKKGILEATATFGS